MRTDDIENELDGVTPEELSSMTVGEFVRMLSNEDPDQKIVFRQYSSTTVPSFFRISRVNQRKSEELGALVIDIRRALKVQVNERVKETEEEKLKRMKKQIEKRLSAVGARKKRELYLKARKKGIKNLPPLERFIMETCRDYPGVVKKRGRKPKKKEPEI